MPTKPKPTAAAPSRAPYLVAIVVALVAAAAIIAVVSSRGGDDDAASGDSPAGAIATGEVTVEGTPLPQVEDLGDDPAVGRAFPALEGQDLFTGAPLAIAADGSPKVVMFLAHWCPHCQAEVPRIVEWLQENGQPEGVELYGVSTGVAESRGNYPPAAWLSGEGWDVPTMADSADGAAAAAAGLSSYPFFVVVDADGNVVARDAGELEMSRFEELIELARGA
jgi:cytochrome c biogenesis protein CcmG/thiol:disulfide interchange protein DsbE